MQMPNPYLTWQIWHDKMDEATVGRTKEQLYYDSYNLETIENECPLKAFISYKWEYTTLILDIKGIAIVEKAMEVGLQSMTR